jgi:hypothetical protein
MRGALERLLGEPLYGLAFMAWEDAEAVGYLVLCFDSSLEHRGKGAWVDEPVKAAKRGRPGIGTQLFDLGEDIAGKAGAKVLHLEVIP